MFLPGPQSVWLELSRQIREGILLKDAGASLYRITLGWLVSTLLALPVGILMGNFRFFEGLFEPFIDLVRYMPAVAFVPLTILWTGVGDGQKILILFIGTFFQEVLMIMDNVKSVPRELIEVSSTFGLSRAEILSNVILRYAMPGIWIPSASPWAGLGRIWLCGTVAANVGLGVPHHARPAFLADRIDHSGHSGYRADGIVHRYGFQGLVQAYVPLDGQERLNHD
jgi:NitT/TauT family transport system permease protein